MGNTSSIHFIKTENEIQTYHNDRSQKSSNLLPQEDVEKVGGGVEVNRSADQAEALKNAIVKKAILDYKEHVGQKFRATSYLWSAVVNIKPDTTMQDLERLADHFKTKYGFQCYQIAIHRDEGHKDEEGNIRLNQHAHLEFVTLDENTGKSLFRGNLQKPKALSQIQTETADILGMQRGEAVKKSGRKRIEPRAYAQLMNETRQKHNAVVEKLNRDHSKELGDYNAQKKEELGRLIETLDIFYDLSGLITEQDRAGIHITWDNIVSETEVLAKRAVRRYADREATLTQEKQELETSNAELNKENNKLARINTIVGRQRDNFEQQKQELEANNEELLATLTTTLTDLTGFVAPHDKKLTIKEIKPLLENVRLQWKDINQRLGEVKIFTQGDYKALRALKDEGLNIDDLKKRIVALEQEAKEHKEAYKALQEQYKDYLSPKAAQELTDAKTKAETALADLQTTHKALETKYSALETSQTSNTPELEDLRQKHTKELEKLNTAHTKAVEDLNAASALKDKQIVERFFAVARHQGYPVVGFLVGKRICYFALKEPEWEDFKGSGLFFGRAEKPDYEALLLETIKRYYAKLLDWVGGNNVLEGVGWKDGLEIVERDDDKGVEGLSVGGDVDLATAIEKCYDYDRLAHWQEKEGEGILENVRTPTPASKAFETRIAPVWFKPRLEGLNIRLYDFLGKDLPQIDVVAFKDDWGLMRETMDYIASLNRQKLRDTHKEKRQQHAKGWYARSKAEKRVKQRAQEQAKQLKTNTPTPTKSKPTPKPTEPLKSPQPTQSTTPKKPSGM
ncbi:hypothetical protein [Helicobacter ailurogastricus]|uniref:Mobilization protein n=1 Tax=Helicobacter ailurogastricus TaxID=1578720 RepID=A0A0K2X7B4_9HELI|nr:hypothetical protein [Helicobacter ailurogastricus]CRF41483.1 mobilization protein [Helicobacter ailurogastricus]CRF42061.1 mobilization protein [Helicobacter ailurogastricus]